MEIYKKKKKQRRKQIFPRNFYGLLLLLLVQRRIFIGRLYVNYKLFNVNEYAFKLI